MNRVFIKNIKEHVNKEVMLKVGFIALDVAGK